jgi:hypothetical protein
MPTLRKLHSRIMTLRMTTLRMMRIRIMVLTIMTRRMTLTMTSIIIMTRDF